jgi:hypothetical protein
VDNLAIGHLPRRKIMGVAGHQARASRVGQGGRPARPRGRTRPAALRTSPVPATAAVAGLGLRPLLVWLALPPRGQTSE